jgi:hypothetical protein
MISSKVVVVLTVEAPQSRSLPAGEAGAYSRGAEKQFMTIVAGGFLARDVV